MHQLVDLTYTQCINTKINIKHNNILMSQTGRMYLQTVLRLMNGHTTDLYSDKCSFTVHGKRIYKKTRRQNKLFFCYCVSLEGKVQICFNEMSNYKIKIYETKNLRTYEIARLQRQLSLTGQATFIAISANCSCQRMFNHLAWS